MLASNVKTVRNDMKTLLRDAQDLFHEATSATGEKADELRQKGISLLEAATVKAQELQSAAVETGKEIAETADDFVKEIRGNRSPSPALSACWSASSSRVNSVIVSHAQIEIAWSNRSKKRRIPVRLWSPAWRGSPKMSSACCSTGSNWHLWSCQKSATTY
jgi:ElaB/YqjD/DUF883 family membrane-anchored ribosome-binding protein